MHRLLSARTVTRGPRYGKESISIGFAIVPGAGPVPGAPGSKTGGSTGEGGGGGGEGSATGLMPVVVTLRRKYGLSSGL